MNALIREEAAEWVIEFRLEEVDAAARERFATWARSSPEHVRAYLELLALWDDAAGHDKARAVDVDALIELARAEANVVALDPSETAVPPPARRRNRLATLIPAAAAVLMVVALAAWIALSRGTVYSTGVGQQLSVGLPDGSRVELNALSRIRVLYSDKRRAVELISGQALFRVAKDANRPFVVASGDTCVRAVGTQFDVHRKRSSTVVTVLEGRVALLQPDTTTFLSSKALPTLEIGAGEQVVVTASAIPQPHRSNVEAATAWRQQQLIFESTPLPDVAEEFNRFNTKRLVVEDESLAGFLVNGNFPALDPASLPRFLTFLRAQPGIEVEESGDRIVVTRQPLANE